MKTPLKRFLSLVILFVVVFFTAKAQTPVSGGISTNTTWTAALSPYIVIDTVVVFPGVTLTIEPGVVVKFEEKKQLEIRQATLIALGTYTDSITFTSNSATPIIGNWSCVYLNFAIDCQIKFCNVRFSSAGIDGKVNNITVKNSKFIYNNNGLFISTPITLDSSDFQNNTTAINCQGGAIKNSVFHHNTTGISCLSNTNIYNCFLHDNTSGISVNGNNIEINNCNASKNQIGISGQFCQMSVIKNCIIDSNSIEGISVALKDTVINCLIKNNGIGIHDYGTSHIFISENIIEFNEIGIKLEEADTLHCNKICNNTLYDVYFNTVGIADFTNNYWYATDSATISAHIFDGHDNIDLGLVHFIPTDTIGCSGNTDVPKNENEQYSFNIYPNPASDYLILKFAQNTSKASIKIYNLLGALKITSMISHSESKINISDLPNGVYILETGTEKNILRQKFIKRN